MTQSRYITRHLVDSVRANGLSLLMSLLGLGVCFIFLGLCGFALLRQEALVPEWLARDQMVAYLRTDFPEQDLEKLVKEISGWAEVEAVKPVSRRQAHEQLDALLGQWKGSLDGLGKDFLPASLQITVRNGKVEDGGFEELASRLRNLPTVEEILYGKDRKKWLQSLAGQWVHFWLATGGFFVCLATLVVYGVVRQSFSSRHAEVSVYRLVGAPPLLVKLPYYVEGILLGVLGASLAVGLLVLASSQVGRILPSFWGGALGATGWEVAVLFGGLLACAAFIGWLGSRMGLGKSL